MEYLISDLEREQSVTNSSGTVNTSIVSTSPVVVSAGNAGFNNNNVTRLSTSASNTGTSVWPPSYNANLFVNNRPEQPQQSPSYRPQPQPTNLHNTSQRGFDISQSNIGQRSPDNLATTTLATQPTDLIKQLLIRNLKAAQILQIKLKQEQEKPDRSTPEHQETVQNLQRQQLKTKNNFLQLTQKLKEIRGNRPVAVASPSAGTRPQPLSEQPITGSGSVTVSAPNVGNVSRPLSDQPIINSGGLSGAESSPMTVISRPAKTRPKESETKMESRFFPQDDLLSPHLSTCEFPLSTDFVEASIYASSPNSLFMYDQEKMDMQSTMPSIVGTSTLTDTYAFQDNFELEPKYETSQDLSNSVTVTSTSNTDNQISSAMIYDRGGGGIWVETKQSDDVLLKKNNTNGNGTNPTLTELNLDLLDDIQTMIDVDMNTISPRPSVQFETVPLIKQETSDTCDRDKTYETLSRVQVPGQMSSESFRGQVKVKQEPPEYTQSSPYPGLQSVWNQFVKKDSIKSETYTPLSPMKTVKELSHSDKQGTSIDISDTSTLQQLLHGRPLDALVRTPRTRSISENMDVRPHTSVAGQSRKRGSTSAGLESMDRKWEEIKKFIHMETQDDLGVFPPVHVKRERKRYDSTSSVMTLTSNEDEESDSDRDIDDDSDSDFEGGTDLGQLNPDESLVGNSKEKQYFWQYNVQSKGPKGTRVHFEMEEDPHVLHNFEDPVFDPVNSNRAGVGITIKHGGKARKGDGNDIVPNPKRLCQIGLQLRKINKQINDFVPVSELPSAARNKTRKEKNKLASRACRLKKKAQHEANKVKLNGLESEHYQLLTVINKIRKILVQRLQKYEHRDVSMADKLEELIKECLRTMIAGNTTDFVNRVVRAVEGGDITGGINFHARRSYPKELHN